MTKKSNDLLEELLLKRKEELAEAKKAALLSGKEPFSINELNKYWRSRHEKHLSIESLKESLEKQYYANTDLMSIKEFAEGLILLGKYT
ncbi:hypothetical protein [Flavivirga eckloniae]|uniref:Uncharacterized protein n=1 Tax=Flavivirga eckloniae TaxID=1803846 RepID=A0A2K9PL51_9FLAO|nr:hypothetical protein [Flavivirga eckloniae]AUP77794.1 hypothetical protein C1H87_03305 [Flavivirga eckloniae]